MQTIESLRDIFESQFALKLAEFGPDTSPADIDEWDSNAHVALVLEIESRFAIHFTPAELGKLTSVGAICHLVEAKLDS